MNNFEKIIGYDSIKTELLQVCDMIKNRELLERLQRLFWKRKLYWHLT